MQNGIGMHDSIRVFSSHNGAKNGFGDNSVLHEKKRTVLEGHAIKRIKIYYGEYIPDQIKGKIFDKYPTHVADWYPTLL